MWPLCVQTAMLVDGASRSSPTASAMYRSRAAKTIFAGSFCCRARVTRSAACTRIRAWRAASAASGPRPSRNSSSSSASCTRRRRGGRAERGVKAGHPVRCGFAQEGVEHLMGPPDPEPQPSKRLGGISDALAYVGVNGRSCRRAGLHGEGREAHLCYQEFQQAVLELEQLARPVRGLPQPHDPYAAEDMLQRLEVSGGRARGEAAQRQGSSGQPADHLIGHSSPSCRWHVD
jgi:hypothetical protein